MADTQGASIVGSDDRPLSCDPRKGKDPALPKPKKKRLKKGGLDDWDTTLAVVQRVEIAERGGVASQFIIRDQSSSPTALEGPPSPQPHRSGRARTEPQLLRLESAPTQPAQPRPHCAAPIAPSHLNTWQEAYLRAFHN